jgi:hypothetical protein
MKIFVFCFGLILLVSTVHASSEFGNFSEEQICKAGIATNNGRSAKDIRFLAKQGETITVAYARDDGRVYGYACKIEGNSIQWRDQSMSSWNNSIKLSFALSDDGSSLSIKSVVFGEAINKSYKTIDF